MQGILARVVEKMKSTGFVTDVLSCGESKVRQTLISACTSKATWGLDTGGGGGALNRLFGGCGCGYCP